MAIAEDKPIYQWPLEWYNYSKSTFRPQARSQTTPRTFSGGRSVYGPFAQAWVASLEFIPNQRWNDKGQAIAAFMTRLEGQAGLIRIGDVMRRTAQLNRKAIAPQEAFSDDTNFTDGTGFIVKPVPAFCVVSEPARRGDKYLVVESLPPSYSNLLSRGDLLELQPRGIWSRVPSLHENMVFGSTDAQGRTGIEIRPRLSQDYARGDKVVLDNAQGIFQLADDEQGAVSIESAPDFFSTNFNLVQWVP